MIICFEDLLNLNYFTHRYDYSSIDLVQGTLITSLISKVRIGITVAQLMPDT
jgi:hypothetical protein